MKKFQVTVNGNKYEVEVEEIAAGASTVPSTPVLASPPQPAAKAPVTPKPTTVIGATKVPSPMPGVILDIKVKEGDQVKEGDVVAILEAMKMENEIVALATGSIASVNVSKGATVETGDLIVSIG
ncbi:MAG: biotin/lipoyl-binding protein [Epulopiscium sp.]|nr:biotin/lipoyl-binding protein [Candidatus Epulonipiscium sp.]